MEATTETRECHRCSRVRSITNFRLVKGGKYRARVCNTCRNGSKETVTERFAYRESIEDREKLRQADEIPRTYLFLKLHWSGKKFDEAIRIVDRVYPRR